MSTLTWIILSGLGMVGISLVGAIAFLAPVKLRDRLLLPLVSLSAGSLLGGAFFHMLPAALKAAVEQRDVFFWLLTGFCCFFVLEQALHWRSFERTTRTAKPQSYLVLLGDGLHNLLGGLAVGGAITADLHLGLMTWVAAAAHELPQELGDFGVLVHSGWSKRRALMANALSASTFIVGELLAYEASTTLPLDALLAFSAGNFLYIGASDLVPEVNKERDRMKSCIYLVAFLSGLTLLYLLATAER